LNWFFLVEGFWHNFSVLKTSEKNFKDQKSYWVLQLKNWIWQFLRPGNVFWLMVFIVGIFWFKIFHCQHFSGSKFFAFPKFFHCQRFPGSKIFTFSTNFFIVNAFLGQQFSHF
jgi:hypothetical protein